MFDIILSRLAYVKGRSLRQQASGGREGHFWGGFGGEIPKGWMEQSTGEQDR